MKKKLLLLVTFLLLTLGLTACMNIGGKKMELTKEEQNIIALQFFNSYKGVTEVKFTDYWTPGATSSRVDVELNGNSEDSVIYNIFPKYLTTEHETKRLALGPAKWNENTQSYWLLQKYEEFDDANTPGERNPSKIKIIYLDGSSNQ